MTNILEEIERLRYLLACAGLPLDCLEAGNDLARIAREEHERADAAMATSDMHERGLHEWRERAEGAEADNARLREALRHLALCTRSHREECPADGVVDAALRGDQEKP